MSEAIVSGNCRIRCPEDFSVGRFSIVDDFSYFSTRVEIGEFCHVSAGCTVIGGRERLFRLGDFSGIATGVRILCGSDDIVNDVMNVVPGDLAHIKSNISGDVVFDPMTGIGANSVVMPDNHIPEGTVIGALSFVPQGFRFEPWSVYVGHPVRMLMPRNRDAVMRQVEAMQERLASAPGGTPG